MKKIILLNIVILMMACSKPKPQDTFSVTLSIQGNGNYQYQIGKTKSSGHVSGSQSFSGVANVGDFVLIAAQGDSVKTAPFQQAMNISFSSNPIVGGQNWTKTSTNPKLTYQY